MATGTNSANQDMTFKCEELYVNGIQIAGTQASNITGVAITYTTNDPSITPNGAITIADGSSPTVAELLEFCVELKDQIDDLVAALEGAGVAASS